MNDQNLISQHISEVPEKYILLYHKISLKHQAIFISRAKNLAIYDEITHKPFQKHLSTNKVYSIYIKLKVGTNECYKKEVTYCVKRYHEMLVNVAL